LPGGIREIVNDLPGVVEARLGAIVEKPRVKRPVTSILGALLL